MIQKSPNIFYKILFCLLFLLSVFRGIAQDTPNESKLAPQAPAPPAVVTPVKYCQNAPTWSLSQAVTASAGCTLNWYGTNATGGTASAIPSVVDTSTLGDFPYYVSQTNATGESTRAVITVKVVNVISTNLFCDGGNNTDTSVAFDWSNIFGHNYYHYTYSINGGPTVTGQQLAPSSIAIPVSGPNTPVTFTITSVDNFPCYVPETRTCAKCTNTITPTFGAFPTTFCQGSTTTSPLPTISTNGISGTWAPAFSTATAGQTTYTFTPTASPCASNVQAVITVNAPKTPTFNAYPTTLCQFSPAQALPASNNGVTGTWNPTTINTSTLGPKSSTFVPDAGQCVSSTPVTLNVTVVQNIIPTFNPITVCMGSTAAFPTTSIEGYTGTWNPATINTSAPGTLSYTFTPTTTACATTGSLSVTVRSNVTTVFNAFPSNTVSYCSGATGIPPLPATSSNSPALSGTWNHPSISNTASDTYIFTPNDQCASVFTLNVQIVPKVDIVFNSLPHTFSICIGSTAPALLPHDDNSTPIQGLWNFPSIDTSTPGLKNYVFTAAAGECVNSPTYAIAVTVTPKATPAYGPIQPFCEGSVPPEGLALPTTINGVVGSWTPSATIDNSTHGNFQYHFQPAANQCSNDLTLNIVINQKVVPIFTSQQIAPFCVGTTPIPTLPTTSDNGITGTWQPATIDNTANHTYTFVPDFPQCATNATMNITVTQPIDPGFSNILFCENDPTPDLDTISPLGISGTWTPTAIDPSVSSAQYVFQPDAGECANPQTITATVNQLTLHDVTWTVGNYFSDNATVTFTATDSGNYLYQLDGGPEQESNVFHNVASGIHTITVYDANGCSTPITKPDEVIVIGYPHFFTPNGDGFDDHWNITDLLLVNEPQAVIFIFDRYGKLLKQIAPAGEGWDGIYNGYPLPSSDYWFLVKYTESGKPREFKAHFSLKR